MIFLKGWADLKLEKKSRKEINETQCSLKKETKIWANRHWTKLPSSRHTSVSAESRMCIDSKANSWVNTDLLKVQADIQINHEDVWPPLPTEAKQIHGQLGPSDRVLCKWVKIWQVTRGSYVVVQNSAKFDKSFCTVIEYAAMQRKCGKN